MKLNHQFTVDRNSHGYTIQGYIPGLKKEDLDVVLQQNNLTILGVRLPSPNDMEIMKAKLANVPNDELDNFMLRIGAGRFGRFSETYKLPKNVDTEKIQATYQGGVLRVTIPIKTENPPQSKQNRFPFYTDKDIWWK